MDFFKIKTRIVKKDEVEVYPDFIVGRSKDLMVRGKSFYAIWDEEREMWSTEEYDVQRLVDKELSEYKERFIGDLGENVRLKLMRDFSSNVWVQFRIYVNNMSDSAHQLDEKLTFLNDKVTKKDHVSKRLPYPLEEGSISAWNRLVGTLYLPEERQKIEWAIGSVIAGDSKDIQKFLVLYGEAGGGKSTILNIIQKLFTGYYTTFESRALASNNNSFSTEVFKGNPLVAIEHDGDLSRIEDNTKLNSIISHEDMTMNEKYKPGYTARANCFLFMGTNKPVKITDGKSGIIRRLIDVRTSGVTLPVREYQTLLPQIDFELGAIAYHCLQVYRKMGKNYYSGYKPLDMILQTDVFFNFVESNYYTFKQEDGTTLAQAWEMYKTYCDESLLDYKLPRHKFREELKNYFKKFEDMSRVGGKQQRSVYIGFLTNKFESNKEVIEEEKPISLVLDSEESIFDKEGVDYPAQYASSVDELPIKKWITVETTLSDLNTNLLHFVKMPVNHIVVDFDIRDSNGEKSLELNLEAASKWPATYAEYSKSQSGIHLHYFYDGDPEKLSRIYSEGIEIKVFTGDSSLRRKLSKCNNVPIAHINSGLPLKGDKMIDMKTVSSEKALRELVVRNLNKEIHPGTKPSIDFIYKILDDAYNSGLKYDLTQLRPKVLNFAIGSSHQSEYCINLVGKMKFQSEEEIKPQTNDNYEKEELVFYDVEVFKNLFLVSWKYAGENNQCVRMINPTSQEIEDLFKMKLVGFNCRRYDNHILYARYIGYDLQQLYDLSQKIIGDSQNGYFREAYNISYADVYDFSSIKQSLKRFEVDLGLIHKELGLPWDQPVPEEKWHLVAQYCDNDVIATEKVFEDRKQDFIARQILAELSGLSINDTTQMHTARIMFGDDPKPQEKFVYTDLSVQFPGYLFDGSKSLYKGEDPGEGGFVYAEPGMYENVALLDVASMHPSSILAMNMFGKYTNRYKELLDARMAIKHKDYDSARKLLDGMLSKFLDDPEDADDLAYALKIHALNIVYGLTSARFPNKFKDPRNVDNIVAKRGALFMIDLKNEVQKLGFKVIHIKTDSIKIPNATKEIIDFIMDFGKKYGYTFEHEATFSKMCLVNDAVYIAKYKDGKKAGQWTAVGAEFSHPVVFKSIFSKEPIDFKDLCETKSVTSPSALYLDMNEDLPDVSAYEKELAERRKKVEDDSKKKKPSKLSNLTEEELLTHILKGHNYIFVGKVGSFYPVKPKSGGGLVMREKEGKYYSATGTKGYRWLESEVVKELKISDQLDSAYHDNLVSEAIEHISKFGDYYSFVE